MNLINKVVILIILYALTSCNNKNIEKIEQENIKKNYVEIFNERNISKPEMVYPIEYYKNQIIENQRIFRHEDEMSLIIEIKDIIPGFLCFLAGWGDTKAQNSFIVLYTFDKNNNFVNEYLVGNKQYLNSYRKSLIEQLPGTKINPGLISIGDFNNDGINEILSYSLYPPEFNYVFAVFGYNVEINDFTPTLFVPVFINFENMFSPVEYMENGFRILEIINNDPLELIWNNYIWDNNTMKYTKQ